MTTKITTTPSPLEVVDKINSIIDDKLDKTGTATYATTLSGLTATVTELNYVDGVTSNIQAQLNEKLGTSGKAASATKADTATTAGNVTGIVEVTHGGTNATTATNARKNLGLSTAFTAASISGKVITLTDADGATTKLTIQDTAKRFYGPTKLDSGDFTAKYDGFLTVIDQSAANGRNIKVYNNGVLMASHYDHHASQAFGITPFKAGDVLSASAPSTCKYYKMELR